MFRQLVERHRQSMYAAAYAVLRNEEQAEDAVQEAFLRIYLSLPDCRLDGIRTWMTRIAVNAAIDERRREKRRTSLKEQAAAEAEGAAEWMAAQADGPEETLIRKERDRRLHGLIGEMNAGQRNTVHAYYIEERSQREIASSQRVELKTVESRLYRARQWLRSQWEKGDGT
ncbi:RNA polymerase sigma factor [Paenibacillus kobensis]|uniref:RNA polymerase sigma factor n=1 Tax=Paenibacillus kobensis TaxID=59841 RepID=UPI000FDBA4ED|nr:sigma-70 family RNA polymerase sigma factor [Paenibacillus kobensis]